MILCKLVLFLIFNLFLEKSKESSMVPDEIVQDLYSKYKEAVLDEKINSSSRRLFRRNKQYEIHVKKLKEVNGFKKHNLMVKEYKENLRTGDDRNNNPFIYINNPVESKIPKSFLTLQEFKEVLTNRVKLQRNEVTTKHSLKILDKTKISTSRMKHKNVLSKHQSKIESKKLENTTNFKTNKLNSTIVKNITNNYKKNVTTKIPTRFQTIVSNKPMINISTTIKSGNPNQFTSFSKESSTQGIESMKTNEFKFRSENEMKNMDLKAEIPKSDSIYLSPTINKTGIDSITSQVTIISNSDRISMIADSLLENELKNYTEKQSNNTFTVIFYSKTEEESTTQTNVGSMTTIKTTKSELKTENQMNNVNLRAEEPKNETIHLSLTINKTKMDNMINVTPISHYDGTSTNADLYNEKEVIKYTEKKLNDTVTTIFKSKSGEESATHTNFRSIITLKTNELELTNEIKNLRPESPRNDYVNLSKTLNKTLIDNINNTIEVITISNDDRTSINTDLLNENELKNSTEKESNDTFTAIFDSKTEEQSRTKSLINVSPEISSNETEPTTTRDTTTTNVVSEKTTLTKIGVGTIQVRRKTAKSKRATTQKVSIQVPRKRSTLGDVGEVSSMPPRARKAAGPAPDLSLVVSDLFHRAKRRPLVFMGSR